MNSIKIDWIDGYSTSLKKVIEYDFTKQPMYIKYQQDDSEHILMINLLSVSCILVSPYMERLKE